MPEDAQKEVQVHDQIKIVNGKCNRLNNLVGEVESRLSEVIRNPEQPTTEKGTAEVEKELVPVASSIRNIGYEIDTAITDLEDYLHRLEV